MLENTRMQRYRKGWRMLGGLSRVRTHGNSQKIATVSIMANYLVYCQDFLLRRSKPRHDKLNGYNLDFWVDFFFDHILDRH